jgi:predicted enzyme related to lactoylglutathione lyase
MKLILDTIIIFVQDIGKLKNFYVGLLGLEIMEEKESTWLLLKAGKANIGLHKIGESYSNNDAQLSKTDSNTKIVFGVDEDMYKLREYLLSQNVAMKEVQTFPNYDFMVCDGQDPEGNVFQLKQRKK